MYASFVHIQLAFSSHSIRTCTYVHSQVTCTIILLLLMLDHEFIYTVYFITYYLFASSAHSHTALYASKSILIFVLCLFVSFSLLGSLFTASSSSSLLSSIVRSLCSGRVRRRGSFSSVFSHCESHIVPLRIQSFFFFAFSIWLRL